MAKTLTLDQAKAQYVHRFTCEHVPHWAQEPMSNGKYCAPQYATDREWYDNTEFPPHRFSMGKDDKSCYSSGQTWPMGISLDKPFTM